MGIGSREKDWWVKRGRGIYPPYFADCARP